MRPRSALLLAVIILLALAVLIIARRNASLPTPLVHDLGPKKTWPPGAIPPKVELTTSEIDPSAPIQKSDPAAAKRALARCLASMSLHKTDMWARHLEAMHSGASPEFRRFARDFLAAAGDDVIPIVQSLLAECESAEAKFLLAAVLGETRRPEAVPMLQELIAQNPGLQTSASALYSIGMARTSEGYEYLTKWLETTRASKPRDVEFLLGPALSAIGQHGAQSVDFIMAEAVKRTGHHLPSTEDILGMIRGADAFDRLRRIVESEPDWNLKRGAMIALGSSANSRWLEHAVSTAEPVMAAVALLAARNLPDVWAATSELRSRLAERVITEAGVPTGLDDKDMGYLALASMLPPDKARAVYESVVTRTDAKGDVRVRMQAIIAAFADQPDIGVFVDRMQRDAKIDPREFQRSIEIAMERAALPGKNVGGSPLVAKLLSVVKDPATQYWQVPLALRPAMRSGVSEESLSSTLEDSWRQAPAIGPKHNLMGAVIQGAAYSPTGSVDFTQPQRFLATVLREESEYTVRLMAAYACLVSAEHAPTDPDVMRSISSIVEGGITGQAEGVEVFHMQAALMGSWYARHGRKEEIAKIQAIPDQFVFPSNWNSATRSKYRSDLAVELKRAIDAIRLAAN